MTTTQEYSLFPFYVYKAENKPSNRTNIPTGWTLIEVKTKAFAHIS